MGEVMTSEEIYSNFPSEWVLVGDPETEENLVVKRGKVLWHGADRGEMDRFMQEVPAPFSMAVLYTGRLRKDREYVLSIYPADDHTA